MSATAPSSSSSSGSSHLQISVEPAQSSFFAGEDFACSITFTNTRVPVPQSQPLPARSTFDIVQAHDARRSVSTSLASYDEGNRSYAARQNGSIANNNADGQAHPSFSATTSAAATAPTSIGRLHRKSQSVDIRTFARRNQLDRGPLDDDASDEKYYRTLNRSSDGDDEMQWLQAQELLQGLPGRQGLVGKGIAGEHAAAIGSALPSSNTVTSTPPMKRHNKAFSVAALPDASSPHLHQHPYHLGMGHPQGQGPLLAFASPRLPSHRVNIDVVPASPASSRSSSAAASSRRTSEKIGPTHPHSRKKSVAQVQAEDLSATFELDSDSIAVGSNSSIGSAMSRTSSADDPPESPSSMTTPRASIDGRTRERPAGFYGLGDNSTMESVLREDITKFSRLGPPAGGSPAVSSGETSATHQSLPFDASQTSVTPGTETVLWTFAQFGGYFQVDESLIKPGEFEQVKQRLVGMPGVSLSSGMPGAGGKIVPTAIGGGELGAVADSADGDENRLSSGWGSYLRNALSTGGGGKRTSLSASSHRRTGSTLLDSRQKTMASRSIPILSNPPSMVAIDLDLAPGESRTYAFRVPLPPDLPPSYIGRAISFSYVLTLGTNRTSRNKRGVIDQKSRLVRIPMRVYNHVNISGVTAFYDLTNPIINVRDEAVVLDQAEQQQGKITQRDGDSGLNGFRERPHNVVPGHRKRRSSRADSAADRALLGYASELLATCRDENAAPDDDVPDDVEVATMLAQKQRLQDLVRTSPSKARVHLPLPTATDTYALKSVAAASGVSRRRHSDASQAGLGLMAEDDDLPKNSLQAVELLSRNSQKVSYDISKDGRVAAVLTLVKSKYRLGDTVMGVVTMNGADSIARVVRIAATLETHEDIESTLATLPAGRAHKITRTVHASFHDSTLDTGQACFSLPIPSGATPNFDTSAVRLAWTVRLAFLTLSNVRRHADGVEAASMPRLKPAPHLAVGPDDGYGAYHHAYRAVPALAGPWTGAPPIATAGDDTAPPPESRLEVVECAVPLTVLPHSTRFTVGEVSFMA